MKEHKTYKSLRHAVFGVLDKSEYNGMAERIFDIFMVSLIMLNVVAVVIEPSVKDLGMLRLLRVFETISIAVFSVEYILRIWVSDLSNPNMAKWKARLKYAFSPMAFIDLVSVLPFYIPLLIPVDLRVLRTIKIFRLLRIFKTNRYTKAMVTVTKVFKNKAEELISSLFIVIVLMVIASVTMFNIENAAQPDKFVSVFDAMWWSVATLTTVGYGDIYPVTAAGKILAAAIAILGIGIVSIPTGIIASGFVEMVQQSKKPVVICPHCGKNLAE